MNSPLVEEISFSQAQKFSQILNRYSDVTFFDSVRYHEKLARYSFIALDPFEKLVCAENENANDYLNRLTYLLEKFKFTGHPNLPPFQGGAAGYLSYDLARDFEKLPNHSLAEKEYPKLALGLYDLVIAIDYLKQKAWVFSSGLPELDITHRYHRAKQRLAWILSEIKMAEPAKKMCDITIHENDIESNFSEQQYKDAVAKAIQYIFEGDIFEVNLSQRFKCKMPTGLRPFHLYQRIAHANPATFASYINFNDTYIISSSPERFLQIMDGNVETRPIKGTIKRSNNKIKDAALARQLQNSEKDCAENAMIVDLMRNDLSKVCVAHSVNVSQFCGLESYENLHHLVSVIHGKLKSNCNIVDVLRATMPGGSITGAPKIRAMEIIDELEPTRRGPYCGSAIYIGFDGVMDSSILIRTYVVSHDEITFQAGGAIVLDSDPLQEYQETLVKAETLRNALVQPAVEMEIV